MRPAALLRLAVAGTRTDTTRIALTAIGSLLGTLAVLAAATVLAVKQDDRYTNGLLAESGLRPGVATALLMLTVPVLLFVGQCARLGAPARDRRLAAIRLAGATPAQGRLIAAVEAGAATLLGTVLGLAVYLVGRRVFDAPDAQDRRPLPTDVLPPWPWLAAIVVGLPVLAVLVTSLLLRKVVVSPLGVVRRTRNRSPRPWPGLLIVFGLVVYAGLSPSLQYLERRGILIPAGAILAALFLGGLAAAVGVVSGAAWLSYTVGRLLGRYARRPATLLAGRRLQLDPWAGSRSLAALLTAVLFGAGAAWITATFRLQHAMQVEQDRQMSAIIGQPPMADGGDFYTRAMQLVGYAVLVAGAIAAAGLAVAVITAIVERRRSLAALTASGVPRAVLGRAIMWQSLSVAVPALMLAIATGLALGQGFAGSDVRLGSSSMTYCPTPEDSSGNCPNKKEIEFPEVRASVHIPWADLGVLGGWSLGAAALTGLLGVAFLRTSTAPEELRTT
jgi:hypothetical protein